MGGPLAWHHLSAANRVEVEADRFRSHLGRSSVRRGANAGPLPLKAHSEPLFKDSEKCP